MERSLRKLSTGEDNVTNGQASGKQRWDAWSDVQGEWVGARAVLTLAEILLGGAAVRMAHGLSFSISSIVSWHSAFLNTSVEEDKERDRETRYAVSASCLSGWFAAISASLSSTPEPRNLSWRL